MNKRTASGAVAALTVIVAQAALGAGSTTATFTVQATVVSACTSVNATNLIFGNIVPGQSGTGTSTISVTCASGTPYTVDLDNGLLYQGGAIGLRNMVLDANNAIEYSIFKDASHTAVWGSGVLNGTATTGVGTGSAQAISAYGIAFGQNTYTGLPANAGNYTDTITVTLSF